MFSRTMNPAYRSALFLVSPEEVDRLPASFAVVTACNPGGQPLTPEENRQREEALRQVLAASPFRFFPITGCSPDQSHAEPGFGIGCDLEKALHLARLFEQEAIYWIDEGSLELVPASGFPRERLSPWGERVLSAPHNSHLLSAQPTGR
jgi:hypothetical protein